MGFCLIQMKIDLLID